MSLVKQSWKNEKTKQKKIIWWEILEEIEIHLYAIL